MASTSSSTIIASPLPKYDIFLSFRGEDTRNSFTDHLYTALIRTGLHIFKDSDEIGRGEELGPEIKTAIKASKASIVVLSQNYATSRWCLEELWLILECRKESTHFVLPVFYHVDPSDVRNQKNSFEIKVRTSSINWTNENVKRWKDALTEVADLSGLVLSGCPYTLEVWNYLEGLSGIYELIKMVGGIEKPWSLLIHMISERPETIFLKKIVDNIYYKVACKKVNLPRYLTGMNARDNDIKLWLDHPDIKVLAISGMGGSGKTTLAQYIVSSNWQHFEISSVVEDIGGACQQHDKLDELFKKFGQDLLGERMDKITLQNGNSVSRVLERKKALIVFDDVDEPSQLERFLGTKKINERSKIIITTQKSNTHNWFKPRSWKCQEYKMQLLDADESLKLLSLHAFGFKIPKEGYHELANEVLQYCEGNPLALVLLGSSLSEDISITFWRSALDLLKRDMGSKLQCVLVRSFDSLSNQYYKELFLHIACFFVGEDKDYVEKILDPDYCALSGIKFLINRCLLSVSQNNKLMMHHLIQEMGRSIIRGQSNIPAKRSRVWLSDDSYKIMRNGKGSETMEGFAFDVQMLDKQMSWINRKESESLRFKTDSLINMGNLKLLKLNDVHLIGSYESFSEDLRWLCWRGFHLKAIPLGLLQQNLVAIDMQHSNMEIFEPPIVLVSLKTLNLQGSRSLLEIRNISRLPELETLILCHCNQLARVCESIGSLMNLAILNMIGCASLPQFQRTTLDTRPSIGSLERPSTSGTRSRRNTTSFSFPHSLVWLSLRNCALVMYTKSFLLSFSVQPKLAYLDLGGGLFENLPRYNHLENLRVLDLTLCRSLEQLLCLPSSLAELYVYFCKSLKKITFQSHRFTLQEFGYQGCARLSIVEGFFKLVPVAMIVDLGHLKWLKEYGDHMAVQLVRNDDLIFVKGKRPTQMMLYEFGIMSTSLRDIKDDPKMISEYLSKSSFVSFIVPPSPRRLKGLNVIFKYTISSKEEWVWFAKISTSNDGTVDYMYNPIVFGDPGNGNVGLWLSYWPIGSALHVGDYVTVSIVAMSGLEVHECGASLVYTDDDEEDGILNNETRWVETVEGDLSEFQLSTGAYYLCRRDLFHLMEVGRLTPGWLSILVGDTIDDTEVRGWRKTGRPDRGRPKLSNPSLITEMTSLITEMKKL